MAWDVVMSCVMLDGHDQIDRACNKRVFFPLGGEVDPSIPVTGRNVAMGSGTTRCLC